MEDVLQECGLSSGLAVVKVSEYCLYVAIWLVTMVEGVADHCLIVHNET
jgi:hypothetical protein